MNRAEDSPRPDPNAACAAFAVELRTAQWEALVEWYRDVLGLVVLLRDSDGGYALLQAGAAQVALLRRADAGPASPRYGLCLEIAAWPPVLQRLQRGGTPFSGPRTAPEGYEEATLTDPDGNRIRLICWSRVGAE